ncbi:hypothetical protein [Phenylobacterium sp.]|uniref:hypothetical protein n=1 Tax=Phenylobacterium sp. TaxID=1871053 RepID=UPI00393679A6
MSVTFDQLDAEIARRLSLPRDEIWEPPAFIDVTLDELQMLKHEAEASAPARDRTFKPDGGGITLGSEPRYRGLLLRIVETPGPIRVRGWGDDEPGSHD